MGSSYSSGEDFWNKTRTFVRVWRGFLCAFLVAFFFYMHAVRYTHSFDLNCANPGTLISDRWNWDFILQATYGFFLVILLWSSGEMLNEWYNWKPYAWFVGFNIVTFIWLVTTAIYLSVEASKANTTSSAGNAFNDFRICGVYGSLSAYSSRCKLTGPYIPGLLESDLGLNGPKIFQLVFHWLFVILTAVSLIYVPTAYKKSQLEMGKTLAPSSSSSSSEPLIPDEESDTNMDNSDIEPTKHKIRIARNNRARRERPDRPNRPRTNFR